MRRSCLTPAVLVAVLLAFSFSALAQSGRARLVVTVKDETGAVIPDASVVLAGVEASETRGLAADPRKTSMQGTAVFEGLAPGSYAIRAGFPGFASGLIEVKLRPGDNRHDIVLVIESLEEAVIVAQDGQAAASSRTGASFGAAVSDDQLASLSDDPDEMARQLKDLAGPNAIIKVDSFEGLQLPPKSQIKSVHVTRDQFAAESPNPGDTFVEIITQPGIGPVRGGLNVNVRAGSLSARNPFAPVKGEDQNQRYGLNVGGALVQNKSSFSINANRSWQYTSPNLYAAAPGGGTTRETLRLRTPNEFYNISSLVDYALTRDQTLRFGFYENGNNQENLGVGAYDYPERAYTSTRVLRYARLQHAGPIGRRTFVNTRAFVGAQTSSTQSATEAPTIVVQDAFTTGGAQRRGRERFWGFHLASDLDHIRGIHSWRTGVFIESLSHRSTNERNYLGTFTFADVESYEARQPSLYTRFMGNPLVTFYNLQIGLYVQDDIRVSKGLTLSPGVRYSTQNISGYRGAFEPRFGLTWSPRADGATTVRTSAGVFHNWLSTGTYEQTIRVDGVRQRELVITNPAFPDPGAAGVIPAVNKYVLGDYHLPENVRFSGGIDQALSRQLRVTVLYNYIRQTRLPRGRNLNPLVDGSRPDPAFANVIEAVTDARLLRHELFTTVNASLAPPGAAANRGLWHSRRVAFVGNYQWVRARRNAANAFDVPPTGSLEDEWGNGPGDLPYWTSVNVNSTQLRNLNVGLTWQANAGYPYMHTTGRDDNGDGILNDRPAGAGVWSLRGTRQSTISARVAYTLTPGAPAGASPSSVRYRVVLFASVNNLTNRPNYGGFSGVAASPFFGRPTTVANPRRIDVGMNVNF